MTPNSAPAAWDDFDLDTRVHALAPTDAQFAPATAGCNITKGCHTHNITCVTIGAC